MASDIDWYKREYQFKYYVNEFIEFIFTSSTLYYVQKFYIFKNNEKKTNKKTKKQKITKMHNRHKVQKSFQSKKNSRWENYLKL